MEKNLDPQKLFTVANYAKMKGRTTQRIYQLIKLKEIPVRKLGGKVFVYLGE